MVIFKNQYLTNTNTGAYGLAWDGASKVKGN
jgi:hypothetical protein